MAMGLVYDGSGAPNTVLLRKTILVLEKTSSTFPFRIKSFIVSNHSYFIDKLSRFSMTSGMQSQDAAFPFFINFIA